MLHSTDDFRLIGSRAALIRAQLTYPAKEQSTLIRVKKDWKDWKVQDIPLLPPVRARYASSMLSQCLFMEIKKSTQIFPFFDFFPKLWAEIFKIKLFDSSLIQAKNGAQNPRSKTNKTHNIRHLLKALIGNHFRSCCKDLKDRSGTFWSNK